MKIAGRAGKRASAWLVIVGAGVASLAAGWGAGALLIPTVSPAKTVAMRFPAAWTDIPYSPPPVEVAESQEAQPPQWLALMNPQAAYPLTPVAYFAETPAAEPAAAGPVLASSQSEPVASAGPQARFRVASVGPVPMPHAKPAMPRAKADTGRKGAVFNDKQIASIKQRLALTAEQEQYWPTIEGALREVTWKKDAKKGTHAGHQMAAVDTSRVDMERLKSIAVPLVMSFREDQKRELRSLAHLMGLEEVASAL